MADPKFTMSDGGSVFATPGRYATGGAFRGTGDWKQFGNPGYPTASHVHNQSVFDNWKKQVPEGRGFVPGGVGNQFQFGPKPVFSAEPMASHAPGEIVTPPPAPATPATPVVAAPATPQFVPKEQLPVNVKPPRGFLDMVSSNLGSSGSALGTLAALGVASRAAESESAEYQNKVDNIMNQNKAIDDTNKTGLAVFGVNQTLGPDNALKNAQTKNFLAQAELESLKATNPAEYLRRTGGEDKVGAARSKAITDAYTEALKINKSEGDALQAGVKAGELFDATQRGSGMQFVPGSQKVEGGWFKKDTPATQPRFVPTGTIGFDAQGNPVRK